jgi:cardiolipin synthase
MNLANNLSVLRILLVPFFVTSLLYYSPQRTFLQNWGIAIFLIACMTDGVDGYVARRLNQKTILGSYIDPIADKLLLLSGFLSLSFMSHLPGEMRIPAWVTISVVTRDFVILTGAAIIFLTTGKLKAQPLLIGKITTFFQMGTLFMALVGVPDTLKYIFFVVTTILTVISGVGYIRVGGRMVG